MTKYLSMNGTSDYISVPSFSWDEVIMDINAAQTGNYQKFIGTSNNGYIQTAAAPNDNWDATTFSGVNVNGQPAITGTDFVPANTRVTLDGIRANNNAYSSIIFRNYPTASGFMNGSIYSIKFLLSGVIKAFYDMSTGTVNDQSGNGNNATLYGGAWLDSGGTNGTPVTYTYDTKQSIYSNQFTNFDTKQSIYKSINQSYDTKQAIYKAIQELFDTEQVFTQAYTQVSYTYDMKIQQYKDIQESLDTKQAYYTDISVDLDTKQVIYKQIQNLYDTLIQIRNTHDETLYGTLTIQRVIEHRLTINKRHSEDLQIERVLNHILRV